MRMLVASLEAMASDMGQTAQILGEAGQQCQFAQDFIVMITQDVPGSGCEARRELGGAF
jgi:hypothetical protein